MALHGTGGDARQIVGDVAVAVHPEDARYKAIVGKKILLPLVKREIPIVADTFVDPKFGTGAVKVSAQADLVEVSWTSIPQGDSDIRNADGDGHLHARP